MKKVRNGKVCRRLAVKNIRLNKKKNTVVMIAIMLTCILFTSLFTIGGSILKEIRESTMRQVGIKSHAGLKYAREEDYEKLKKDGKVKDCSYRIIIGEVNNSELNHFSTEISYAEEKAAKWMFAMPTKGTMPKEELDCAVSTLVLDELGIPHKLGVEIPLEFTVHGEIITQTFRLTGFWEGDPVAPAQDVWVSRAYCEKVAGEPKKSFGRGETEDFSGYWQIDINYANSFDIEGKTLQLLERNGYDTEKTPYGINWAYETAEVDAETILLIVGVLTVILLSGYLIIYNVFYIRVSGDIRSYGLLKTVGTTGKQLKKIVRTQALLLCVMAIPLGLLVGWLIGVKLVPVVTDNLDYWYQTPSVTANPLVFIGAALFTLFTVFISCIRPCKTASKVSPIEAVRYTENESFGKRKQKQTKRNTPFRMAMANLKRSKRKVVLVVVSLSLSLILLNGSYSIVQGFDMDKYLENSIIGDFCLGDASLINGANPTDKDYEGIIPQIKEDLSASGISYDSSDIYFSMSEQPLDKVGYRNFEKIVEKHQKELEQHFEEDYVREMIAGMKKSHSITCKMYGIDGIAAKQIKVAKGSYDEKKFLSGDYVILSTYNEEDSKEYYYDVGDKMTINFPDGSSKTYEVMALGELPYPLTCQFSSLLELEQVILPQTEYLEHIETKGAMYTMLDVKEKEDISKMEDFVENYCEHVNEDIIYTSRETYEREFRGFQRMFLVLGGSLSVILAMIGILNFINAIVTGILNKKHEYAMLEAVGMTGKQLKATIVWEGIFYAFMTLGFSLTIGMVLCRLFVEAVVGAIWFFSWHFSVVPILICAPILVALAYLIPALAYGNMRKSSVVERLRNFE